MITLKSVLVAVLTTTLILYMIRWFEPSFKDQIEVLNKKLGSIKLVILILCFLLGAMELTSAVVYVVLNLLKITGAHA